MHNPPGPHTAHGLTRVNGYNRQYHYTQHHSLNVCLSVLAGTFFVWHLDSKYVAKLKLQFGIKFTKMQILKSSDWKSTIYTLTRLIVGISDGRLARVSLQIVRSNKHKQHY